MVRLSTGIEVPASAVAALMMSLERLPVYARREMLSLARDPGFTLSDSAAQQLKGMRLVLGDGSMPSATRDIVLAAVNRDGSLRDPVRA